MKKRLDQRVFELGLTDSVSKARATIMAGNVFVDGRRADKPGTQVGDGSVVEHRGETLKYVSRGGYKLEKALVSFGVSPEGKICADIGASTGGFTDVLLQNGAKKVYAVDVGYGQLAWSLRSDERVVSIERTNARYLEKKQIPDTLELAVMDLSFISIRLVLPAVRELLSGEGEVICLIKPQFEAGREKVGKKGVVRSPEVHLEVINGLLDAFPALGFTPVGLDFSPIRGPEGNIEYLCHLKKGVCEAPGLDPENVVKESHEFFI